MRCHSALIGIDLYPVNGLLIFVLLSFSVCIIRNMCCVFPLQSFFFFSKTLSHFLKFSSILTRIMLQGTTVVDNLLYSDDIRYMLDALRTLGLNVEDDKTSKRAIVEGCGGLFPVGKDGTAEIELFLGNAGTAMRPLTAAVAVAGGNSRFVHFANCNFLSVTRLFNVHLFCNCILENFFLVL